MTEKPTKEPLLHNEGGNLDISVEELWYYFINFINIYRIATSSIQITSRTTTQTESTLALVFTISGTNMAETRVLPKD